MSREPAVWNTVNSTVNSSIVNNTTAVVTNNPWCFKLPNQFTATTLDSFACLFIKYLDIQIILIPAVSHTSLERTGQPHLTSQSELSWRERLTTDDNCFSEVSQHYTFSHFNLFIASNRIFLLQKRVWTTETHWMKQLHLKECMSYAELV